MEVLTVLGFDPNAELVFEAPVPAARMAAASGRWHRRGQRGNAFWPLSEADAEALLCEVPGGLRWLLEAAAE